MRTKQLPLIIKSAPTDGSGTFTAIVSTFGPPPDTQGDIIEPGAFDASLRDWRKKRMNPTLWYMHGYDDPSNAIGKLTDLKALSDGLWVAGRLDLATTKGQVVYEAMLTDKLNEFSIGYGVVDQRFDEEQQANILTQLDLLEVSVVMAGANRFTRLIEVKAETPKTYRKTYQATVEIPTDDARSFDRDVDLKRRLAALVPVDLAAERAAAEAKRIRSIDVTVVETSGPLPPFGSEVVRGATRQPEHIGTMPTSYVERGPRSA